MRKPRSRGLLLLIAIAVSIVAKTASAQSTCPNGASWCVGPDGRVIVAPPGPSVHVDPNLRAQADAEARARAEQEMRLRAEISRVLAWKAYLSWQLTVRAEVEASVSVQLDAEARAAARRYPDRWAGVAVPALGAHPDRDVRFPRIELAPVSLCAAIFTGRALPSYAGACVPLRLRFDESWSLLLDGSFVFERYGDARFHSVGFHPALAWSFAHGRGELAGSHGFARAGFDGQIPIDGGAAIPDAYLGAHLGLGVHAQIGSIYGLGMEVRGLVRGGTNGVDDGAARRRVRLNIVTLTW